MSIITYKIGSCKIIYFVIKSILEHQEFRRFGGRQPFISQQADVTGAFFQEKERCVPI